MLHSVVNLTVFFYLDYWSGHQVYTFELLHMFGKFVQILLLLAWSTFRNWQGLWPCDFSSLRIRYLVLLVVVAEHSLGTCHHLARILVCLSRSHLYSRYVNAADVHNQEYFISNSYRSNEAVLQFTVTWNRFFASICYYYATRFLVGLTDDTSSVLLILSQKLVNSWKRA